MTLAVDITTLGNAGVFTAATTLLVVFLAAFLAATAERKKARAERYAAMVGRLVDWTEVPYRVRRRASADQACTSALADRIHDLQQQLVVDAAELAAECPWLSKRYDHVVATIKATTAPFIQEAWQSPPIMMPEGMNLNGWGPHGLDRVVLSWRAELRWRFGWRRLVNPGRLLWQRLSHPSGEPTAQPPAPSAVAVPAGHHVNGAAGPPGRPIAAQPGRSG